MNLPRISLIIPAYNEAELLPRLLDSVDRARNRYDGGRGSAEVIVADNGSTDATVTIAEKRGCRIAPVATRTIGAVRNGGALAARGGFLAFTDADSQIHERTFEEIDRRLSDGRIIGGTTGISFERQSSGIRCTYALLVLLGIAVRGIRSREDLAVDAGVVFCRHRDFELVGGYSETLLFAEDTQFLLNLRRLGRRDGRRLVRGTHAPATCSTRKFDEHGDWHYFTMAPRMIWNALRRRDDLASRYWYQVRPGG